MAIVTKLRRMVTYLTGLLPMILLDLLVTWSCEVMWQTKSIISPIPRCLWPASLAEGVSYHKGSHPHGPLITWSSEIMWQTKTLYQHYHNVYHHQTRQDGDFNSFPQSNTIYLWLGVVGSRDKLKSLYIHYFTVRPLTTKLCKLRYEMRSFL